MRDTLPAHQITLLCVCVILDDVQEVPGDVMAHADLPAPQSFDIAAPIVIDSS